MLDRNTLWPRAALVAVGAVVLLLVASLAVPIAPSGQPTPPVEAPSDAAPVVGDTDAGPFAPAFASRASEPVEQEVQVVVELHDDAPLSTDQLRALDVNHTYTEQDARYVEGRLPLSAVRHLSRDPQVRAVRVTSPRGDRSPVLGDTDVSAAPDVSTIGASALHASGVTGEGVTVGIIDRGFRPSDPSIAANVGAYRAFAGVDDSSRHGTAVASVVADTAPNATLHLAAVGPSTTPTEYRDAVEWLRASGADVIVDSGSYFGVRSDAREIERIASTAAEDVVFVASAGNYARRHWTGTAGPNATDGDWVAFDGRQGNAIGEGRISGQVSVHLSWNGSADYDLFLFRERPGRDDTVAASTRRTGTSERITTRLPKGRYYVGVRMVDASAPTPLKLYASHRLETATPNGSLAAPATAPGVLAVGAVRNGSVAPFSSRGPVGDRDGVGVLAPDGVGRVAPPDAAGTSYAAPYVAGTVALLQERNPSLPPAALRRTVLDSAHDVGPPGTDPAAGHGVVDARAADALAAQRTLLEERAMLAGRLPMDGRPVGDR